MIHNTSNMPVMMQYGLAFQHLLAVFAGTVFVPIVLGLPIPMALFFSGVATLVFHYFTGGKIPLYFSSSFTVLAGMAFIRESCVASGMPNDIALCYTCFGAFVIGVLYLVIAQLLRFVSRAKITRFFPPVLTGSFIMALGIDMLFSATYSIKTDWVTGLCTIAAIGGAQLLCRGGLRMMSINVGVLIGIFVAYFRGGITLDAFWGADSLSQPFNSDYMAFRVLERFDMNLALMTVETVIPLALIAVGEHISDMLAIGRTAKIDYMRIIGLPRTVSANGLATLLASVFGAPKNTAYTQTTGLIQLNRICDPFILRITAVAMIFLSFSPKVAVLVGSIPIAVIGGITLVMYCMVVMVGWRTIGSAGKERMEVRSLVIIITVLAVAVGVKFFCDGGIQVGNTSLSSLTLAFIAGILLNIIIPGKHENAD